MENTLDADSLIAFMEECHEAESELRDQCDAEVISKIVDRIGGAIEGEVAASVMIALAIILSEIAVASTNIKLTCAVVGSIATQMARGQAMEAATSSAHH
jgi:hypothetical protein